MLRMGGSENDQQESRLLQRNGIDFFQYPASDTWIHIPHYHQPDGGCGGNGRLSAHLPLL